jgi:stage II sporulation protein AA (anti-sigma F factor antagonist)
VSRVQLSVSLEQVGDSITVRPVGEVDMSSVPLLGDSVRRAFEKHQADSITLDLTAVSFIDCRGLRALVATDNLARENGYSLRIECGNAVRRMIEASHVGISCD